MAGVAVEVEEVFEQFAQHMHAKPGRPCSNLDSAHDGLDSYQQLPPGVTHNDPPIEVRIYLSLSLVRFDDITAEFSLP